MLPTPKTLEKPCFPVVFKWIESEPVTGAVVAAKAPKAGLHQLVETWGLQFALQHFAAASRQPWLRETCWLFRLTSREADSVQRL